MKKNLRHHIGVSPFLTLPIDMINTFPLDHMHLVLLGVMKRMLAVWLLGVRVNPNRLPPPWYAYCILSKVCYFRHAHRSFERLKTLGAGITLVGELCFDWSPPSNSGVHKYVQIIQQLENKHHAIGKNKNLILQKGKTKGKEQKRVGFLFIWKYL